MKTFVLILNLSLLLAACGTNRPNALPSAITGTFPSEERIIQSLFTDRDASISEENIQKILNGTYELPQQLRVAVIKFNGRRSYAWNDENYLKNQQSYIDTIMTGVKQSGRVTKIAVIPDLVLPQTVNYTTIREAGVRLQADAILIFSTTGDVYRNARLFSKTDIKAFATTQLLVMDVRTGLIPFSTIVTKDVLSQKTEPELDLAETQQRIQNQAVLRTLAEIVGQLNGFLQRK
jgi:predicted small lipoprotein YifL